MSIPDFIKETTTKIRHAVIGGEITNTIADGIEKIAGVAQDSTDTTKDIEEYIKAVELEWDSDPNKDPEVLEARGGQPRLKDRFENTDRQLAQTSTMSLREMLLYPEGFVFPMRLKIFKNPFGIFEVNGFDIEQLHPLKQKEGKAYYVSKNGNDTNDGLTLQTAFQNLPRALTRPDVDTIYIEAGEYGRQHCYTQNLPDRDIKIIAIGGQVTIGCYENPVGSNPWQSHSDGVYKFTRSAVVNVYDTKHLNQFGNYTMYTKKNTLGEVESEQGTWFLGADNMLYVHTKDNQQPESDTDIKVVISGYTIASTRNRVIYMEGITFEFGFDALKIQNAKLFLAKRCGFNYSQGNQGNGLSIVDTDMSITQGCDSYENYHDGFNYHADNWTSKFLNFIEIDNRGYRNGFRAGNTSNDNGSTSHINCKGIRINGYYFENRGPNVPDVGTNNDTWDIGCAVYNSRSVEVTPIDYLTEGRKWIESGQAYGSEVSIYTQMENGKIYTRNSQLLGGKFVKTPENLIEYSQK